MHKALFNKLSQVPIEGMHLDSIYDCFEDDHPKSLNLITLSDLDQTQKPNQKQLQQQQMQQVSQPIQVQQYSQSQPSAVKNQSQIQKNNDKQAQLSPNNKQNKISLNHSREPSQSIFEENKNQINEYQSNIKQSQFQQQSWIKLQQQNPQQTQLQTQQEQIDNNQAQFSPNSKQYRSIFNHKKQPSQTVFEENKGQISQSQSNINLTQQQQQVTQPKQEVQQPQQQQNPQQPQPYLQTSQKQLDQPINKSQVQLNQQSLKQIQTMKQELENQSQSQPKQQPQPNSQTKSLLQPQSQEQMQSQLQTQSQLHTQPQTQTQSQLQTQQLPQQQQNTQQIKEQKVPQLKLQSIRPEETVEKSKATEEMENYIKLIQEKLTYLQNIAPLNAQNRWQEFNISDQFQSHHTLADSIAMRLSRGEIQIQASMKEVVDTIYNIELRPLIDPNISEARFLQRIYNKLSICYFKIKGKQILADRDLVILNHIVESENGPTYILQFSISHIDHPPKEKTVRAEMILQGWILTQINDNCVAVINITKTDPKQTIPSSLQENVLKKRTELVIAMKNYIEKVRKSKK